MDGSAKQNVEAGRFSRTRVRGNGREMDGSAKQNFEAGRFSRTRVKGEIKRERIGGRRKKAGGDQRQGTNNISQGRINGMVPLTVMMA
jgi:hypothetical protein